MDVLIKYELYPTASIDEISFLSIIKRELSIIKKTWKPSVRIFMILVMCIFLSHHLAVWIECVRMTDFLSI